MAEREHTLLSGDQAVLLNFTLFRVSFSTVAAPVSLLIWSTWIVSQSDPPLQADTALSAFRRACLGRHLLLNAIPFLPSALSELVLQLQCISATDTRQISPFLCLNSVCSKTNKISYQNRPTTDLNSKVCTLNKQSNALMH